MRRRDGASIKAEDDRSPRGSSLYVPRVSEAPSAEEEPSMKSVTKMKRGGMTEATGPAELYRTHEVLGKLRVRPEIFWEYYRCMGTEA